MKNILLQVENLRIAFCMYEEDAPFFCARRREVEVITELSVSVQEGEVMAIVGASGSGKTLLADTLLGLFEPNAIVSGSICFDGKALDSQGLGSLRGHGISLVPQSVTFLNPLMRIGKQVEGFLTTESKEERHRRRQELFRRYELDEDVAQSYPFELSGGMMRRVLLCCALMDRPRLIIADEPTPGLDLDLAVRALQNLRDFANAGGAVLLITHDIELALRVADRIAIFCDGTIVEETSVENFASPELLHHPFTRALWHALPEHGMQVTSLAEERLSEEEVILHA